MSTDVAPPERRHTLLAHHYDVENRHDLGAIMKTFSDTTEMLYNHQPFRDHDSIQQAHAYMGFSGNAAFADLQTFADHEHLTADEIVIEGRVTGRHVGEFQGFPPTNRQVELPFVAFYRFDRSGRLTSERVVMNLGPLAGELPTSIGR